MKKIQDVHLSLGNSGCLIFCYLFEAGIKVDISRHFNELVELDIVDTNCYVNDGNRLLKYFGSDKRIARGVNENGNTIVPYRYSDKEHFVVVNERQEIIFNSLENSTCVRLGEPNWEGARWLI